MTNTQFPILPLEDRLYVKPMEPLEKTSSGLFIPHQAQDRPMVGRVVACGPKVNLPIEPNTLVVYGKYAGTEQIFLGENYLNMRAEEVMGVICDRSLIEQYIAEGVRTYA